MAHIKALGLKKRTVGLILGVALLTFAGAVWVVAQEEEEAPAASEKGRPAPASKEDLELGKSVYFLRCVWCHGPEGAGDGPGADRLWPRPRDFTQGTFKIRHTGTGDLPTEEDLFLTVTNGLPGSAMPPWDSVLSAKERRAVVRFVMNELVVDRDFQDTEFEEFNLIDFGKQVPSSPESIEAGLEVYMKKGKCAECHGEEGRGDGNATQKDEWGFPILPADLHKCWNFRGNRRDPYNPANVFREVSTGLNGTPMPSFAEILSIEDRWHVANFVISLCEKKDRIPEAEPMAMDPLTDKPKLSFVVKSLYTEGEIPSDFDDPEWQRAPVTYVGFGSQIIHKPRNFVRLVDDVWVWSLYNDNEIAYKFEWDDRKKSELEPGALEKGTMKEIPAAGVPVAFKGIRNWPVFNDAFAIQFPARWEALSPPEKPRFIFGDSKNAADIWKWESDGSITEYTGRGAMEPLEARPTKNVSVPNSEFKEGQWRIIMKRALTTDDPENDTQFVTGEYIPTTFFAWDGHNGDYGRKMSISTWYNTILVPPVPIKVYVYPFIMVFAVIGIEWWLRSKFGKGNGNS